MTHPPSSLGTRLVVVSTALLSSAVLSATALAEEGLTPHLRKQGTATQLVVDGKPFLVLGGELLNSSASGPAYMAPVWPKIAEAHLNTVLAGISWEMVEPEEGRFDFERVDALLGEARTHGLRLILLWFGSWKNGKSSYAPYWAKKDFKRFWRARDEKGRTLDIFSTFCEAARDADARAFAALMGHLREADARDRTVVMVQVENEVGVLGDTRDRSPAAEHAFQSSVPETLMARLRARRASLAPELLDLWKASGYRASGTWTEVFGAGAAAAGDDASRRIRDAVDETFMAWQYARYVGAVAEAGRREYPLPLYANAWLHGGDARAGAYPSGGPLPETADVWRAGAPAIDLLAPDLYAPEFEDWSARYTRAGNPLFIPETNLATIAANAFVACGRSDAIGVSPFAIDRLALPGPPPSAAEGRQALPTLSRSYEVLSQLAPTILAHQGRDEMTGFTLDKEHPKVAAVLGGYELDITLDEIFGRRAESGYGLVIAEGPDAFIGAGAGFRVSFRPKTPGPPLAGLGPVDEGSFRDGTWVPDRRLNGDETAQGEGWRFAPFRAAIERCKVFRYE
jgi:Domain of unknown function (DUF5597)/Beta-galactosidase